MINRRLISAGEAHVQVHEEHAHGCLLLRHRDGVGVGGGWRGVAATNDSCPSMVPVDLKLWLSLVAPNDS